MPLTPMERVRELQALESALKALWRCGVPDCNGEAGHRLPGTVITIPFRHARGPQLAPPGDWRTWALVTGRGFGKTRAAAEWTKQRALDIPDSVTGIVAPDFPTAKNICLEGESGLLAVIPANRVRAYNKGTAELRLTNGSVFFNFGTNTQVDAEKVRGYNFHTLWFEELATQRYAEVAWDIANPALRAGADPRMVVTTTPRNVAMVRRLLKTEPFVTITRGRTMDNAANLAPSTVAYLLQRYKDTRLGRQELDGELLEDQPGALWTSELLEQCWIEEGPEQYERVIVGVDPAGSHRKDSDETGIVVCGKAANKFYVIADYSGSMSTDAWRTKAVEAYHLHQADGIVGERNFGGDMVQQVIRDYDRNISYRDAHASRGKALRAEPIQMLYEQNRVHHVGRLLELEAQMTSWVPPGRFETDEQTGTQVELDSSNWSPDRIDALVWSLTDLSTKQKRYIRSVS